MSLIGEFVIVFFVGSCLGRGEAWTEKRFYGGETLTQCSTTLKESKINNPDVVAFCIENKQPLSCPAPVVCPAQVECKTCLPTDTCSMDFDGDGEILPYDKELWEQKWDEQFGVGVR